MSDPAQADGDPQDSAAAVVREIEIVNKKGLHARASAKFVQMRRTIRRRHHRHPRS